MPVTWSADSLLRGALRRALKRTREELAQESTREDEQKIWRRRSPAGEDWKGKEATRHRRQWKAGIARRIARLIGATFDSRRAPSAIRLTTLPARSKSLTGEITMSDGREIIALVAQRQDCEQFRRKNWVGTFDEYLDIVREHPEVTRTAYQRLYDMILSYGVET